MDPSATLLDTPKKVSLQQQSQSLRDALKEFERSFAVANNGAKPGRSDIKANAEIAIKYKEYNKIRDVLAGKLSIEVLDVHQKSPVQRRKSNRITSTVVNATPSKRRVRTEELTVFEQDQLDESPRPLLMTAIGPTPQRDGRALGLFDLLSNSATSSRVSVQTPSQSRKRKIQEVYVDCHDVTGLAGVAQTPNAKMGKPEADILDFLSGQTPVPVQDTGRRKHSKTPVSEGRKFVLSQFFATPSAARYSNLMHEEPTSDSLLTGTSFQAKMFGLDTPEKTIDGRPAILQSEPQLDATPAYLKRSFSFKERLLSATTSAQGSHQHVPSQGTSNQCTIPPRRGTRIFQRTRSGPKPLSQIVAELRDIEYGQLDDDLDALRELENVGDDSTSDPQLTYQEQDNDDSITAQNAKQPTRTWKKKGQKRTTRRAMIRPSTMPLRDEPKFVAAEDEEENEDENENEEYSEEQQDQCLTSHGNETISEHQFRHSDDVSKAQHGNTLLEDEFHSSDFDDDDDDDHNDDDNANSDDPNTQNPSTSNFQPPTTKTKSNLKPNAKPTPRSTGQILKSTSTPNPNSKTNAKTKAKTIDPNAIAHMNFRTLNIKNKNSKAKIAGRGFRGRGRGGKFGRR